MNSSIAPIVRVAGGARLLAALALGVFAGGMLTEGCVLVPLWQSLKSGDFLAWYATHGQRLHAFFSPLTSAAALLAVVAAVLSYPERRRTRLLTLAAAGFALAAVATFFVYFKDANASFARGNMHVDQVGPELTRWGTWHGWRTALVFTSATLSLLALRVGSAETSTPRS